MHLMHECPQAKDGILHMDIPFFYFNFCIFSRIFENNNFFDYSKIDSSRIQSRVASHADILWAHF